MLHLGGHAAEFLLLAFPFLFSHPRHEEVKQMKTCRQPGATRLSDRSARFRERLPLFGQPLPLPLGLPRSHCPFQQHVGISCGLNAHPTPSTSSLLFHHRPPLSLSSAATKTRQIARFRWKGPKMASFWHWVAGQPCHPGIICFYHPAATQLAA